MSASSSPTGRQPAHSPLAAGSKVIVFTSFTEGLRRHAQTFGASPVTISGEKTVEERMAAVDRFQADDSVRVAICNLVAGGVGLNLTAATHVIFQDLDWVPANHLQAQDRAYRLGQRERVTVEYMLADGTLDVYIADLLATKLRLISAVETEVPPDGSMLEDLYNRLRALVTRARRGIVLFHVTGDTRWSDFAAFGRVLGHAKHSTRSVSLLGLPIGNPRR